MQYSSVVMSQSQRTKEQYTINYRYKGKMGNDYERKSHSKKQGGKQLNKQSDIFTLKSYRKPREQIFTQSAATQLPKLN